MRLVSRIALGAVVALVSGGLALAADNLIPGKITVVKAGKLAKIVAKPTTLFTLPGAAPTGGSVRLKDLGSPGTGTNTFNLVGAGWKGLGNPAGSKGYKYKGSGSPGDACKVVLIKEKVIKAVCKGTDVTLTGTAAFDGVASWQIDTGAGDRYCAELGGTEIKNQIGLLKRKDAAAPGGCASPSGAFLEASAF
jgi:hypothetical protein